MALTDYQRNLGPRWHVQAVSGLTDISVGDALSFEGDGAGGPTCNLVNLTTNKTWGEACTHPHPDTTRSNRSNEIQMTRPMGNIWIITRIKPIPPSDRYEIKAAPSSGSGSWTASEG